MKRYVPTIVTIMLVSLFAGQAFAQHTVTYWPNNKTGVVSLTFDDGLPSQLSLVIPTLDSYGMKGTVYIITNNATTAGTWAQWKAAAANGHEIGSHTLSHPYLTQISSTQLQNELQQSKAIIESQIPSQKCLSIAYPYGDVNSAVMSAAASYYIAGRGINWDIDYPTYQFYNLYARGDDPGSTLSDMEAQADKALSWGEWMITYMHSINGDGYGAWDLNMLTSFLNYIAKKDLGVDTVANIARYIKERQVAKLSVVSSSSSQIVLNLTDSLDNSIYNQPLTLRSEVPLNWSNVTIVQGSSTSKVVSALENSVRVVYYKAVPDGGQISLSSGGPQITGLSPSSVLAGSAGFTLQVNGANFVNGATVRWNGLDRTTAFVSATQLTTPITVADVAVQGIASVTVKNPDGNVSAALSFTITGIQASSVSLNPSSVTGRTDSVGTVTLTSPAPAGGAIVTLASSNSATASVPSSVTIAQGATSATFNITTAAVSASTSVTITVSYGGVSQTATLTVAPPALSSVSLSPTSVTGGSAPQGTVTLTGVAPSGGATITLSSSNTTYAKAPSSVTVAAGSTSATFTVTTYTTTTSRSITITAKYNSVSKTAALTVTPGAALSSVSLSPTSVTGSAGSTGTVTLNSAAPTGGAVVMLSSSNTSAATVPSSVTVATGSTSAIFAVTTSAVTTSTSVTITAAYSGTSKTASLTVAAPSTLSAVSLNPASVTGGSSSTGNATLTGAAPTGGAVVTLSSSNTSIAAVPASVTIAAGSTSITFAVTTDAVAVSTSVTITATYNGTSKTVTLTVLPPSMLSAVSLSPASVSAGSSSTGTATLTGTAPTGGAVVTLSSSNTSVATVPASVTIAAGSTSITFAVTTAAVTASTSVTITATYNGASQTATLTVTPSLIVLSATSWSLLYADSQETSAEDGRAVNAFDGNTSSFWHTRWSSSSPTVPHEIQIDLGASHIVGGFRYLPRQDGGINGTIAKYEFYVSTDGTNWGSAVATGTFANNTSQKEVQFSIVNARYIRLRALSEVNGNPWTSVAELKVLAVN
jgi:peptidoglycan/xylan/chitin deacetylase (PgdA/CDA1 family)